MRVTPVPRVFSIPVGVPFLPELAAALLDGRLVPGFRGDSEPLALSEVTIYVPTRRAARRLRSIFVEKSSVPSAILPRIRPLGEFDEDDVPFDMTEAAALELAPPVPPLERLLYLAPLVRAWKERLPAHLAALFGEDVAVPASAADSIWLARDLAALIDELETEGCDPLRLSALAAEDLSRWWQVTLDFLAIVTEHWPRFLAERGQSNPAAHRNARLRLEARRLRENPPRGPVLAAGSTGSIPATAELLSVISRLPSGAVVLPGLDRALDDRSWAALAEPSPRPALYGHPQYGLGKLLRRIGIAREDVEELGTQAPGLAARSWMLSQALRPAETTDDWVERRSERQQREIEEAVENIVLVEASRERDEAAAIAVALREAVVKPRSTAALVTGDRELARRVCSELARFGVRADDSGGSRLAAAPVATLFSLLAQAVFRPGDPVPVLCLLKHPLLRLGLQRAVVREAAGTIELIALRGAAGRPDLTTLAQDFETRLAQLAEFPHQPFWLQRLSAERLAAAREVLARLDAALRPLAILRNRKELALGEAAQASVVALEALGRDAHNSLSDLYGGDAGRKLVEFLRDLLASTASFQVEPGEWPDVLTALLAPETVKPAPGADRRIAIWGALESRLQSVDTLVLGGLNEGAWPRRAEADRFMSRMMKGGLELEPPERRIGQSAHDFLMAMGASRLVLTRSARSGDAPAVPSRWLQRILTFAGKAAAQDMRERGNRLLGLVRGLDAAPKAAFVERPAPRPPLEVRPGHFSVTEVETLRRDPYAIYARRILKLAPLEPLLRDPGAAERGTLFHAILHRFSAAGVDIRGSLALETLLAKGRECFAEEKLPAEVQAIWWPRFERLAAQFVEWEKSRADQGVLARVPEALAGRLVVGSSGVTLSGRADRVDLHPDGFADILDYKTGSSPSKGQAHALLAPQLALEGALLMHGAFKEVGPRTPSDLAFIRLRANGGVEHESVLSHAGSTKSAEQIAWEAWRRLEELLIHFADPATPYVSRALPFREEDTDGDYDHLARVLEWSAGGEAGDLEAGGE